MIRGPRACFVALVVALMVVVALAPAQPALAGEVSPGAASPAIERGLQLITRSCPALGPARGLDADARRAHVVTTAYCAILRRAPDAEGLAYWSGQLRAGLGRYEFVELLVQSPEFQIRQARTFGQTLSSIRLGPGRETERAARAEARRQRELAEEQAAREAEAARAAAEALAIEQAKRDRRIRIRQPITGQAFAEWVAAKGLTSVDEVTQSLVHGRVTGDGQRVNVAYIHLSPTGGMRVSPGDRGPATVGTWAAEIGADVAINGNWYRPYDGPAVSGGVAYGGRDHFYTALFGFTATGDAVIEHHRETNDAVDERVVEAVAGHPTLIFRGDRTTDFGTDPTFLNRHPRTAIGLDLSGDVLILVTVDGRSSTARGMTGDETAQLMERLGAFDAVMLDGGGSTTMWIAGKGVVNNPSGRLRAVGNQIAVFGR